jgi:excisionase family DNA binding protein
MRSATYEARSPKSEREGQEAAGCSGMRLLTRDELAEALKVSLRTVDRMLAEGEITAVRMRGTLVRFYPCQQKQQRTKKQK